MHAKISPLTDNLAVASQIDASDIPELAAMGYRAIINNRPDGEETGQLTAQEARAEAERAGLAYHYLPMTAATLTLAEVEAFDTLLQALPGPILAHCRSGTRCTLLWAAVEVRKGHAAPEALVAEAASRGFDISALMRYDWLKPL